MSTRAKHLFLGSLLGFAFAVGGCVGLRVHGHATVAEPTLVYVSPGVWVVEDHHEPVFFHDHYYWAYRGGVWYRSSAHTRGWIRVRAVPYRVRRIHRPRRYIRYHAPPRARTRRGPVVRDHRRPARRDKVRVRDHRDHRKRPAVKRRDHRKRPAVKRRDHRRSKPYVKTRDHRRSKPPVRTRDHRSKKKKKKKSKVKVRDHR